MGGKNSSVSRLLPDSTLANRPTFVWVCAKCATTLRRRQNTTETVERRTNAFHRICASKLNSIGHKRVNRIAAFAFGRFPTARNHRHGRDAGVALINTAKLAGLGEFLRSLR